MIYVFGDLHGATNLNMFSPENFPDGVSLSKTDYVIITGDFGIPWYSFGSKRNITEMKALRNLSNMPWTTLFIDGNHENFAQLKTFPKTELLGAPVRQLEDSVFWLQRGKIYEIGGKTFFAFGGGKSLDWYIRTPGLDWFEEEIPNNAEVDLAFENLDKVGFKVDYVLTHVAPKKIVPDILRSNGIYNLKKDPVSEILDRIAEKLSYKRWFFGHYHFDYFDQRFIGLMEKYIKLDAGTDRIEVKDVKRQKVEMT